ncbi:MAG TPA: VWA domain-containing protein [Candidatus Acidoferrum sp.]|jgi:VWFA-related protein
MNNLLQRAFVRRMIGALFVLAWVVISANGQGTPTQEAPPKAAEQPAPQAPAKPNDNAEVSSQDTAPSFKVRVNLVLVRVVVRDARGNLVTNLDKQDFQLFDNRKPQVISTFSLEKPDSHLPKVTAAASTEVVSEPEGSEVAVPPGKVAVPQRFVAVVFDDVDMLAEDAVFVRNAATKLFGSLAPTDRVGMYTTSGQLTQEFTADHELLNKALLGIVPRPIAGGSGFHPCPEVSYYQADQIENFNNTQALIVATEDAIQCAFNGDERQQAQAQGLARAAAGTALATGITRTDFVYRHIEQYLHHLAVMPGQRIMVLVSPGFIITADTEESTDMIERANRANIVLNTIDVRGLYTPDLGGDIADPPPVNPKTSGFQASYRVLAQQAQGDILSTLADGTGGTYFHNRNDVDEGLRQAVAAPALSYLLAFSPQNLKIDGKYHTLKVTLTSKQRVTIQARHGYYAPKTARDPGEAAKQEIQEAVFSQEEISDLPVDLQTQFFKTGQSEAHLAVITHVDVKGIRFRKADGRSRDSLTIATAIFDENGNFVKGGEKIVDMRLLDSTFERLSRSGFQIKSSFDVKPGTYLVRQVVRDGEGAQMAARNGAVVIPY